MSERDVKTTIRFLKRRTMSIEEQIEIAHAMWDNDPQVGPDHAGLKTKEIEDELGLDLDYDPKTSLKHLEDVALVEEFVPPGPEILAIAEWMDSGDGEIVNGSVGEAAEEGLQALIDDLEPIPSGSGATTAADGSGPTIRSVVAEEFDLLPEAVEDFLDDPTDEVEVLNGAVDAIEDESGVSVGSGYGRIAFIHMPHRFRLTEAAVDLFDR